MFGWEFPPYSVGGLGKVTYYLTKALSDLGVRISLVLPIRGKSKRIKIIPTNVSIKTIRTILNPYLNEEEYLNLLEEEEAKLYGSNLKEEMERFKKKCLEIVKNEEFNIIHCHDWITFPAGIKAKEISNKPLVLHVHATEFDRSGGKCNPWVCDIEKEAFEKADKIIAVSHYTKNNIVNNYFIDPSKVEVVHNAIEYRGASNKKVIKKKIVLFLGRLTLQKGADYFIRAAKKVLEKRRDILFVIAGSGEMFPKLVDLACNLGIGDKVLFTGRLSDKEVNKIYEIASVYVMPSVSEPFGLTALEAISRGTPVIVSKNSGVREVIKHCLEVDFWDVDELANKILSTLEYYPLREELVENSYRELKKLSWKNQGKKVLEIYKSLI
jgi:glycosyltransferase involved in cell wall biosynthesis